MELNSCKFLAFYIKQVKTFVAILEATTKKSTVKQLQEELGWNNKNISNYINYVTKLQ